MKPFLFLLLTLFSISFSAISQAEVRSKHTRFQMEREVFVRWGKFRPKWYFQLFHNQYRKGEDKRNILQLAPTDAAIRITQDESEKMNSQTDTLFLQANLRRLDRLSNKRYELLGEEGRIESLNEKVNILHVQAQERNIPERVRLEAFEQQGQINEAIGLVRDSYIDDSEKWESFSQYQKELERLIQSYATVIHHYGNLIKLQDQ